jgi:hypothetical protein
MDCPDGEDGGDEIMMQITGFKVDVVDRLIDRMDTLFSCCQISTSLSGQAVSVC